MLPTSFKFRVNPYIKTILFKTQENSRLKAMYFKEIITEQLFIIFILRDYHRVFIIYLALKRN
jgi:hypothetical protein